MKIKVMNKRTTIKQKYNGYIKQIQSRKFNRMGHKDMRRWKRKMKQILKDMEKRMRNQ